MNDKSGIIVMLLIAFVTIAACAGTIIFIKARSSESDEITENVEVEVEFEEETEEQEEPVKEEIITKTFVAKTKPVLTEEEKKAREAKEWAEASKEMNDLYQGSKMQEMIQKKMSDGNRQWFAELFEEYGIDAENQEIIAGAVTEAQTAFFNELMANGFLKDADDEERAEVAEKLRAIDIECEETIKQAGGDAFLAASKESRKTELRDQYLNRLDGRLRNNKMSNEQRSEMDSLYAANQITEAEVWYLPKGEIDERKENINNGAKGILNEEQYEVFIKKNRNPFNFK